MEGVVVTAGVEEVGVSCSGVTTIKRVAEFSLELEEDVVEDSVEIDTIGVVVSAAAAAAEDDVVSIDILVNSGAPVDAVNVTGDDEDAIKTEAVSADVVIKTVLSFATAIDVPAGIGWKFDEEVDGWVVTAAGEAL